MKNKILLLVALFFLSGTRVCFSLTASIDTVQGVFCAGGQKVLNAIASGGTPPYSYSWSTSAVTSSITVNLPGVYTVTVTDAASTTATASVNVAYNDDNGNFLVLNSMWQYSWQDTCAPYAWTGLVDFICFVCDFNDMNMTWNSVPSSTFIQQVQPGNYTAVLTSGGCVSNPYPIAIYAPFNNFTNVTYTTSPSCINVPSGSVTITGMTNTDPSLANHIYVDKLILRSPSLNIEQYYSDSSFAFIDNYLNFTGPVIFNYLPAANDYELYISYTYTGGECLRPEFLMLSNISVGQSPATCGAIEGKVYIDNNNNCTFDTITDHNNNAAIIAFNNTYYTNTDASGNYSLNVPLGNYTVSRSTVYPVYTNCPATPYNINLSSPVTISNIDFADTLDGTPDIGVYITSGSPRVGFPFNYYMRVRNYGAFTANNITISLDYDTTVSFLSGNFTPTVNIPGHIEWNITSIPPFNWANFNASLQVPPNPLLTGYQLNATASAQPLAGEVNLANNTNLASAVIVNSSDPNEKTVMPRGTGPNGYTSVNDSVFKYTVHFQNTGSASAIDITITDTLSPYLNVSSFNAGASSHNYIYTISGNGIVTFYFNNINLPDSSSNEPASHGYVSFEITREANLPIGTVITNTAYNVFDFNVPVVTNTTVNTIYEVPAVSLSNPVSTICSGNCTNLSASGSDGVPPYTYSWIPNIGMGAGPHSVCPASTTVYTAVITDANNVTSTNTTTITVNSLPIASITPSGPTTFCQGNSVTLTSSVASSYLWSNSSTTQSINVTSSGNYTVTVTDANNCSSASPVTTVTVNPNPPAPSITQSGDSLTSDLASNYQWYFNNVLIPSATSQSYHPLQNGNYSVVITDGNGCTASSTDYPWVLTETGHFTASDGIIIYPNPARAELVVSCSEFGDKSEITILNLLGENLLSQKPTAKSQQQVIDVSSLSPGVYFLEVKTEKGILRTKFMKQ